MTSLLFGSSLDPETVGWFQAVSEVDGLTGFFLFLDSPTTLFDGADLPKSSETIVFNEVRLSDDFTTELNIINPSSSQATIEIELIGGDVLLIEELILAPNGVARLDVANSFNLESIGIPDSAYIQASSDVPIAGFEFVRGVRDLLGLNARPDSEQLNRLFFPQMAVLGGLETQLVVVNYSAESAILTMTAHQPDGSLYDGENLQTNPVVRPLSAGEVLQEDVAEMFGFFGEILLQGWIEVESTSEAINGTLSCAIPSIGSQAAVAGETIGRTRALFSHISTREELGFFTGVAVLNSGSLVTNVQMVAVNPVGMVLGSVGMTLRPRERISKLITELIPEADDQDGGFVWVSSDLPVYLSSLFGSDRDGVLANVPPQSVPEDYLPDETLVILEVSPALAVVPPDGTQSFEVTGSPGTVEWKVDGIIGGDTTVGTITSAGEYTAPSDILEPLPVTITAEVEAQSAGASVDVLESQVLAANLGIVQSVVFVSGLQRLYTAELTALEESGAGRQPFQRPAQNESSTIFDITAGIRETILEYDGEDIPKMIPFRAIDGNDYLLLAGKTTGRIIRLDPVTRQSADVTTDLNAPTALVLDPASGDLLVAEADQVSTIPASQLNQGLAAALGNGLGPRPTLGVTVFTNVAPGGIAVDCCTGNIYTSNPQLGTILEFGRTTGETQTIAQGIDTPTQLLAFYRSGLSCQFAFQLLVVGQGAGRIELVVPRTDSVQRWVDAPGARDVAFLPVDSETAPEGGVVVAEAPDDTGRVTQVVTPPVVQRKPHQSIR